jgi:glutamate-ammonia-ligase adenylyltransferase
LAVIATEDQIAAGVADGQFTVAQGDAIIRAYRLFSSVKGAARLLSGGVLDPDDIGEGGRAFLIRETGMASIQDLLTEMDNRAQEADAVINTLLAGDEIDG